MRRPSVLFINRVYPPVRGASGRVLRDLARSFAREGWSVSVVTSGSRAVTERDGSIKIVRVKGRQKPGNIFVYAWLWLKLLIAAARQPRTDLVVTLSDPPMLASVGKIVKKIRKNRHIHWCHDLYPDIFPALNVYIPHFVMNFLKNSAQEALRDADKVIVVGRCMAQNLTRSGMDARDITFIPNWPDHELLKPPKVANGNGSVLPEVNGSKPFEDQIKGGQKFRVLYAGNIGRAHPLECILDAAQILDEQNADIEFAFVGDGPRFDYISRERVRRGLDNIRLLPFQPQNRLREVMESGDVHLISVKEDACGMLVPCKMYSAFAVGRPSIFVGPQESEMGMVIDDFHAGSIVPQNRPDQLASVILQYRMNAEIWFSAHEGALQAGNVFVPKDSIEAWMQRAWSVVEPDIAAEAHSDQSRAGAVNAP